MVKFLRREDIDFCQGVVSVLRVYQDYLQAITHLFLQQNTTPLLGMVEKQAVEKFLQTQEAAFPEWVYKEGFNPLLRQGHRHFLIRIEQVGQVLFAMHYAARCVADSALLEMIREPILNYVTKIQKLIDVLIFRLDQRKIEGNFPDIVEDLAKLESLFYDALSLPVALLQTSPENMALAEFIEDLKTLQMLLLKLAESLRD